MDQLRGVVDLQRQYQLLGCRFGVDLMMKRIISVPAQNCKPVVQPAFRYITELIQQMTGRAKC